MNALTRRASERDTFWIDLAILAGTAAGLAWWHLQWVLE